VDGLRIVLGLCFVALLVALTFLAARRRDRTTLTLLTVATAAIVLSVVNITQGPAPYGFARQYFASLWAMSMFVWFTVVVAVIRSVSTLRRPAPWPRLGMVGAVLTLVVAGLTVPHHDPDTGTSGALDQATLLNRKLLGPTVQQLEGTGKINVAFTGSFLSFTIAPSLILALSTAGVDVCVQKPWVDQFGASRSCGRDGPDRTVRVRSVGDDLGTGERVIAQAVTLSQEDQRELATLTTKVRAWLASQSHLELTAGARAELIKTYGQAKVRQAEHSALATTDGDLRQLVDRPAFSTLMFGAARTSRDGTVIAPVDTGRLPATDLTRWAELQSKVDTGYSAQITVTDEHG
jgi:hypothetical protein